MDLVAPKKHLVRLLARCQGVADKRSTMPVLANVLLTAEGNVLHVAATDLFLGVRGSTEALVSRAGSVAVPARDVFERVKAMPEGPIHISVGDGSATTLKAGGSARRYTLHGMPGTDFPALPQPSADAPQIEVPVATLAQLIAKTHFSISADETRAHLNSALFECLAGRVRMVTTDGHRLSKIDVMVEGLSEKSAMLLPLKAILELRRLCEEAGEGATVQIAQSGPNAFFTIAGIHFSVKLVDAQFPPYEAVIPAVTNRAVRAPRLALSEALRAVSLAASDRTGGIKLAVSPGSLKITSESPESGVGFDELAVDYVGPEISVGFNARYLLDVLAAIDEDEVTLGLSGELDPAVLRPGTEGAAGHADYIAVVMPMRI
ncbi:MAG: DNA polymerase III subunit beta [Polyangiaceae bacterium]|nr:DNA polymerase III subunit beta [Polyangiaceae bacterium]